jgi:ACT domain
MAAAGLNIEGMFGLYAGGVGIDHVLVEDVEAARHVLAEAGFDMGPERDVLVLELEDRPGALAEVTRRIADAGVDVDLIYLASRTRLVLGVATWRRPGRRWTISYASRASDSNTSSDSSRSSISPWWPDVLIASSYMVTSLGQATTK